MFNKILSNIKFINQITNLGSDKKSKIILLINSILIKFSIYFNLKPKPFKAYIGNYKINFLVNFTGTIDELHALTEIFIEKCYRSEKYPLTILDLGANIGLASIWFKINFPKCKIHSYEPNPEVYKVLRKNLEKISGVEIFNLGIGENNEYIQFNVNERSFSSSIYSIPNSKKININVVTLDSTIEKIGGCVDLVKLDIEGSEFSAIKNSKRLNCIDVIVGEIHPEKANCDVNDFIKILSKTHTIKSIKAEKSIFYAEIKQ